MIKCSYGSCGYAEVGYDRENGAGLTWVLNIEKSRILILLVQFSGLTQRISSYCFVFSYIYYYYTIIIVVTRKCPIPIEPAQRIGGGSLRPQSLKEFS